MDNSKLERGRINVYLSQELKDYVDNSAKQFGVSTSAFMTMIIQNYRQQTQSVNVLGEVLAKLKELEQKIEK